MEVIKIMFHVEKNMFHATHSFDEKNFDKLGLGDIF